MAYNSGGGSDLVGKNVETGKRNTIQNQDMMISGNIDLPVKPYTFDPVSSGRRDTPLDAGGQVGPTSTTK